MWGIGVGMDTVCHRIVGERIERVAALSDGVFAVAMTLLVLDLKAPVASAIHGEAALRAGLAALGPRLPVYWVAEPRLARTTEQNALINPAEADVPQRLGAGPGTRYKLMFWVGSHCLIRLFQPPVPEAG